MNTTKRIFVNTLAQYVRTIINTCLSLYSVRLILQALGQSDYGIFSLVAGIVAAMGFVTNALVITTQRHLSFYYGKGDADTTRSFFSNSLLLHLSIAFILLIVLLPFKDLLCESYLNIEDNRRWAASIVYVVTIGLFCTSLIIAPFKALFIAHENIVYLSVIDVLDGLLKLIFAIILIDVTADKLIVYSLMLLAIMVFQLLALSVYSVIKYKECQIKCVIKDYQPKYLKELLSFAGWTTYGMGSIMIRNQGLSILWNQFYSTTVNAAFGIAHQLYTAVSFISTSVLNAMNPQIMKAEGNGDRNHMIKLAMQECKIISSLMSVIFIPLCFELSNILNAWLGKDMVPSYTVMFGQFLLAGFLIDQTTYGLHTANQAVGKIKNYTLIMYTPKMLFLPVAWCILYFSDSVLFVMITYVIVEAIIAFARIPYMYFTINLDVRTFIKNVVLRMIGLVTIQILLSWFITNICRFEYGFLMTIPALIALGLVLIWFCVLNTGERTTIKRMILQRRPH